jgi:flagellar biosynthesis/type III secretory pathway protein FliH
MSPGGCKVDSDFGSIDASLETQLDRIHQELTGSADEVKS